MLLSQAGLTVVQAIYFVLMARSLGVSEYGLFIAVAALGAILAPFALFGTATLAVRTAARERDALPAAWGNGLLVTSTFGGALMLLMAVFGQLVLPGRATLSLILSIGIAELVFANMHHIHAQMFLAVKNGRRAAQLPVMLVCARMLLALAYFATGQPASATTWGLLYLIASAAACALGFGLAVRAFGWPRIELDRLRGELATGFSYAIGLSSTTVYADIDKTMLARMTTTAAAGAYAAAYRIVGIVMAPIFSLLYSSFANFFQHGVGGMRATVTYALRLLPVTIGYGVFAGVVLFIAAPIVPTIFGDGFAESVTTIQWLAVLPLL
ncbi:MAG: polysaccharide biosynthesis protein, partial [Thermoleophilia bacterium]|nr:polysaccharide biosynthesis protein [Thermoleophilia bacterium]